MTAYAHERAAAGALSGTLAGRKGEPLARVRVLRNPCRTGPPAHCLGRRRVLGPARSPSAGHCFFQSYRSIPNRVPFPAVTKTTWRTGTPYGRIRTCDWRGVEPHRLRDCHPQSRTGIRFGTSSRTAAAVIRSAPSDCMAILADASRRITEKKLRPFGKTIIPFA